MAGAGNALPDGTVTMAPKLRLTLIGSFDTQAEERTRTVTAGPFRIGRDADNDWILEDARRLISRHHCTIELKAGIFIVIDTSSNGLFLNNAEQPVGRGNTAILSDGDRLVLPGTTIAVELKQSDSRATDPFLAVLPPPPGSKSDDGDGEDDGLMALPDFPPANPAAGYASSVNPWAVNRAEPPVADSRPLLAWPPVDATPRASEPPPLFATAFKGAAPIPLDWNQEEGPEPAPESEPETEIMAIAPATPAVRDEGERDRRLMLALIEAMAHLERLVVPSDSGLVLAGEPGDVLARLRGLDPAASERLLLGLADRLAGTMALERRDDLSIEGTKGVTFGMDDDLALPERRIGPLTSLLDDGDGEK